MEYLMTFLEGIASFISPCILPMLPIYISYFAGKEEKKTKKTIINSIGFVIGFTIIFIILSIVATTIGKTLSNYMKYIKIIFGIIIIILGLNYIEIIKIKILKKTTKIKINLKNLNFLKSLIFGMAFSISWTPCIGTFLASALFLISSKTSELKGIILIISAILIEKMKNIFEIIKKHNEIIKKMSGIILIIMGIYVIFK